LWRPVFALSEPRRWDGPRFGQADDQVTPTRATSENDGTPFRRADQGNVLQGGRYREFSREDERQPRKPGRDIDRPGGMAMGRVFFFAMRGLLELQMVARGWVLEAS